LTIAALALGQPEPWAHPDGTIHWYNPVSVTGGITWHAAYDAAKAPGGYLATLSWEEENQFVFGLVDSGRFWYTRPGSEVLDGPWLGGWQLPGSVEPGDGWTWINREPFDFQAWAPDQPDNAGGNEDALHFGAPPGERAPMWDDLAGGDSTVPGYVVELSAARTTMGLLQTSGNAWPGYTLLAPMESPEVYLLDNKGRPVHSWQTPVNSAMGAALLEDGSLLRVANVNVAPFYNGGRVELYDWSGRLLWFYEASDSARAQHHDAIRLPGGNVLMIAYEWKSRTEATAAGRNPARLFDNYLLPDQVVEVDPATDSVVWEWHAWDHLVQDFDSTRANYGVVRDHPELVDVNFSTERADWLHCNSLDYDARFDQVIISVHNFGEVWVIDHGTTTEEARGHTGGRFGSGGDLLYRWGNPSAYRAGDSTSQRFFGQHNAQWIGPGLRGAGNILVFNNGLNRPAGRYSTIEEFTPACDSEGRYTRPAPGEPFGPAAPAWVYGAYPPESFYSAYISGAQRLPNGNTLVCEGDFGRLFEVGPESIPAWRYVNPIKDTFHMNQGSAATNRVFRAVRYPLDYPAFAGRDLTPGYPLERYHSPVSGLAESVAPVRRPAVSLALGPNPCRRSATIRWSTPMAGMVRLAVYDGTGRIVRKLASGSCPAGAREVMWDGTDTSGRPVEAGVYLVRLEAGALARVSRLTIIR
jgi:hypothetical protein